VKRKVYSILFGIFFVLQCPVVVYPVPRSVGAGLVVSAVASLGTIAIVRLAKALQRVKEAKNNCVVRGVGDSRLFATYRQAQRSLRNEYVLWGVIGGAFAAGLVGAACSTNQAPQMTVAPDNIPWGVASVATQSDSTEPVLLDFVVGQVTVSLLRDVSMVDQVPPLVTFDYCTPAKRSSTPKPLRVDPEEEWCRILSPGSLFSLVRDDDAEGLEDLLSLPLMQFSSPKRLVGLEDSDLSAALKWAVDDHRPNAVDVLLKNDVKWPDEEKTLLYTAVQQFCYADEAEKDSCLEVVKAVLNNDCYRKDGSTPSGPCGNTPLLLAVKRKSLEMVKLLCVAGLHFDTVQAALLEAIEERKALIYFEKPTDVIDLINKIIKKLVAVGGVVPQERAPLSADSPWPQVRAALEEAGTVFEGASAAEEVHSPGPSGFGRPGFGTPGVVRQLTFDDDSDD